MFAMVATYQLALSALVLIPGTARPSLSVLSVIFGLKQAVQDGLSWLPVFSMLVGICLAVLFVRRQQTLADPMVDLSLFRNRSFSLALGSSVLNVFVSESKSSHTVTPPSPPPRSTRPSRNRTMNP